MYISFILELYTFTAFSMLEFSTKTYEIKLICVFAFCLVDENNKSEKAAKQGPQFVSGVIVKITDNKPLPGRKIIKVLSFVALHDSEFKVILLCFNTWCGAAPQFSCVSTLHDDSRNPAKEWHCVCRTRCVKFLQWPMLTSWKETLRDTSAFTAQRKREQSATSEQSCRKSIAGSWRSSQVWILFPYFLWNLLKIVFCMDFITDDGENALSGHQASVFFNQRFDKTVKGIL